MQNFGWKGFGRVSVSCRNLISVLHNEDVACENVLQEVQLGRIAGPFQYKSISNLRCCPVGLVPKKTGGFRLITHLSHPSGNSVNDFIDPALSSLSYSSFDNAVSMVNKVRPRSLDWEDGLPIRFSLVALLSRGSRLCRVYLAGSVFCRQDGSDGFENSMHMLGTSS